MGTYDSVGNTEIAEEHNIKINKVEMSITEKTSKIGFKEKKKRDDKADNTEATKLPRSSLSENRGIRVKRCSHILPLDWRIVKVAPNINPELGRIVYSVRERNKKYLRYILIKFID